MGGGIEGFGRALGKVEMIRRVQPYESWRDLQSETRAFVAIRQHLPRLSHCVYVRALEGRGKLSLV